MPSTLRKLPMLTVVITGFLLAGAAVAQPVQPLAAGAEKFLGNVGTAKQDQLFHLYWNQITPENAGKWLSVEADRDVMTWGVLDHLFAISRERGFPMKQHTFVWGQQEPRWIGALPAVEQRREVDEWMRLFSERYPDVDLIDVVNEPLHAPPSYLEAIGGAGDTGWDWVVWSFERARQYFPQAKLLINEYNILCCSAEVERYEDIVRILQERGLIDGIGLQGHGLEQVDSEVIRANLDRLALLGLPIYVSELELAESDDEQQMALYQRVFPLLWEHEAVAGLTLWGYRAGQIWKRNAYLIDWFEEERPALSWLEQYVRTSEE